MIKRLIALFIASALLSGCAQSHINDYEPKRRDYELPVDASELDAEGEDGSLWGANAEANYLLADLRAMRPGDILTVKIEEFANAQRGASTSLERQSELNAEIAVFLGLMEQVNRISPELGATLINSSSSSSFNARGQTGRSERLEATVPVMIKKLLPHGHAFVEGHRVVLVNQEEHHFYISGVARLIDVDQENTISSARLADAEIEFTGRGALSDNQKRGWFSRFWSSVWPF